MDGKRGTGRKILVSGGSIAGPALVWALRRAGFEPTLLERAERFRTAGQNIDIRDTGHDVIDRMGLRDAVVAAGTGELGTRYLDHRGRPYAEFPVEKGRDGPTAELEILRGDLSALLLSLTSDDIEHRYGDHITAVRPLADGVEVDLAGGGQERYDALVVTEGRRSATRDLVFGRDVTWHDDGEYIAYGTIDRTEADDDWWQWLTATDSRLVMVRPDNKGTIRANLGFLAPPLGLEDLDFESKMLVLRRRFAGVGWETDRILDGFAQRPEEFYLERLEQVRMPTWARGPVVVLGDAAWGSGPSGMGTTLALVAGYVLAGELAEHRGDLAAAFAAYERVIRPWAEKVQDLPPGLPRAILPKTPTGLRVLKGFHRIAATGTVRHLVEKTLLSKTDVMPRLPDYPALR
jgi:2-polyprenyl-6-methoxyphenol hydroxylase-like FAD-dependent oxidoreductase